LPLALVSFAGEEVDDKFGADIVQAIQHRRGLGELNFQDCAVGAQFLKLLAEVTLTGSCPHLRSLCLSGNDFGDGAEAVLFAKAAKRWQSLEVLHMSGCGVGPNFAASLGGAITDGALLHCRIFNMAVNFFGDSDGAVKLGQALTSCSELAELDLSCCRLGDQFAGAFAAGLASRPLSKLTNLSFYENEFGDGDGATKFGEALAELKELIECNLSDCSLGDRVGLAIKAMLATGGCAKCEFYIDDNQFSNEVKKAFQEIKQIKKKDLIEFEPAAARTHVQASTQVVMCIFIISVSAALCTRNRLFFYPPPINPINNGPPPPLLTTLRWPKLAPGR
jgi:Ran GTPase-activating protein (RanGAP) involved in mRNA processing and transport